MIADFKDSLLMLVVAFLVFLKHLAKLVLVGALVCAGLNLAVLGLVYGAMSAERGHRLSPGEFGQVIDDIYGRSKGKP